MKTCKNCEVELNGHKACWHCRVPCGPSSKAAPASKKTSARTKSSGAKKTAAKKRTAKK